LLWEEFNRIMDETNTSDIDYPVTLVTPTSRTPMTWEQFQASLDDDGLYDHYMRQKQRATAIRRWRWIHARARRML